ncbi:MAG: hypothetical protein MZV70_74320 [Desulfobacterales bacterium]|nr:hypothetical protein [Desulfobacterales bacterium]
MRRASMIFSTKTAAGAWWKEGATDPYLTAHVMYGLALARKAGVPVRSDAFERGVQSLSAQLERGPSRGAALPVSGLYPGRSERRCCGKADRIGLASVAAIPAGTVSGGAAEQFPKDSGHSSSR